MRPTPESRRAPLTTAPLKNEHQNPDGAMVVRPRPVCNFVRGPLAQAEALAAAAEAAARRGDHRAFATARKWRGVARRLRQLARSAA